MKRTPIRTMSPKRKSQMAARNETRRVVLSSGSCQAKIDRLCTVIPTDVHEIKTRARGGSITDVENCLALCRNCHRYITEHPEWSLLNGYVVHSWADADDMAEAAESRKSWLRSPNRAAP